MAGEFCSHCGAQNPPGAGFCQYCGSAMATPPSAPLPPSGPTPPPIPSSWAPPGYAAGGPRPRRRISTLRIIAIVVVVVLMIAVLAYVLFPAPSASPIDVTYIVFQSADNACGLNGIEYYGFNASLSTPVTLEFAMNNSSGSGACTIQTVSATTTGFGIGGASPLPLLVPPAETVTWTVTINVPGSDYTGILTLVVT